MRRIIAREIVSKRRIAITLTALLLRIRLITNIMSPRMILRMRLSMRIRINNNIHKKNKLIHRKSNNSIRCVEEEDNRTAATLSSQSMRILVLYNNRKT